MRTGRTWGPVCCPWACALASYSSFLCFLLHGDRGTQSGFLREPPPPPGRSLHVCGSPRVSSLFPASCSGKGRDTKGSSLLFDHQMQVSFSRVFAVREADLAFVWALWSEPRCTVSSSFLTKWTMRF